MQVDLRTLKSNPMRDFTVDPIDLTNVQTLKASIDAHGFWGGIVCRQLLDGTIEIAAGHHRVLAALEAGITTADVFVRTGVDDEEMVLLYAKENATQRGHIGTATAGTIASAIHYLVKMILTGTSHKFARGSRAGDTIQGRVDAGHGIGQPSITEFLRGIPGINSRVVDQHLANFTASGDYARILEEVTQEILAEHEAELERLAEKEAAAEARREDDAARQARAERAQAQEAHAPVATRARHVAAKAAEVEKTFDLEGVSKYLKNAHQLGMFRHVVTSPGWRLRLAVRDQAAVAKHLAEQAQRSGVELSGRYIDEQLRELVLRHEGSARKQTKQEYAAQVRRDQMHKAEVLQQEFIRYLRHLESIAFSIQRLREEWEGDEAFPWQAHIVYAAQEAKQIIDAFATPRAKTTRKR